MRYRITFIIAFFALCSTTWAQPSLLSEANKFLGKGQWEQAEALFSKHLKKNKKDSAAWFNKGLCLVRMEKYEQALPALLKAHEYKYVPANALRINFAKCYAQTNQHHKALDTLDALATNGFGIFTMLSDTSFAPIRAHDRFKTALQNITYNAYPCMANTNARRFDFWVGTWEVFNPQGVKVGENVITRAKGGCAIHESWTSTNIYSGQSISFYDPYDGKWKQSWVGSGGDASNYVETEDGEGDLQFVSQQKNANGQPFMYRMTFYHNKDNTVRQHMESSTDNGTTWTTAFDGLYKRKE